jgi:hypothetical protein
MSSSQFNTQQC